MEKQKCLWCDKIFEYDDNNENNFRYSTDIDIQGNYQLHIEIFCPHCKLWTPNWD